MRLSAIKNIWLSWKKYAFPGTVATASLTALGGCVPPIDCSGSDSIHNAACTMTASSDRSPERGAEDRGNQTVAICGNGITETAEECDDGSSCENGEDCTYDRYRCSDVSTLGCQPRGADGCSQRCRLEPPVACSSQLYSTSATPFCAQDAGANSRRGATNNKAPTARRTQSDRGVTSDGGVASDGGNLAEKQRPTTDAAISPLDARVAPAEPCEQREFRAPLPLVGLEVQGSLYAPALSSDGQTLYFSASSAGGPESLFEATRVANNQFSIATPLTSLNTIEGQGTPMPSADHLLLFFYSERPGGVGNRDLWSATRPDTNSSFGSPRLVEELNSSGLDHLPWLSNNGLSLLFVSARAGGLGQSDIWMTQRSSSSEPFEEPLPLLDLNTTQDEGRAVLTVDGLTTYFASARVGGIGGHDIWTAWRASRTEPFEPALNLTSLNSLALDLDPFIGLSGREIFFASNRRGSSELWFSTRNCAP